MRREQNTLLSYEQTDILKGIAILCVVISHIGNHYTRMTTPLGGIGVSIFLCLSAYGLEISYQKNVALNGNGLKFFWRKRIIAVWIPYAIVEVLTLPINGWVSIRNFIEDLLLIHPRFQLGWYLNYLLVWYIIFWVLKHLNTEGQCKHESVYFIIVSVLLMIYFFVRSDGLRFEQSLSFLLGLCLAKKDLKTMEKNFKIRYAFILLITAALALGVKQLGVFRTQLTQILCLIDLVIKACSLMGIVIMAYVLLNKVNMGKAWCVLKYIGIYSYELYLVHGYALYLFETMDREEAVVAILLVSLVGTFLLHHFDRWIAKKLKEHILEKSTRDMLKC